MKYSLFLLFLLACFACNNAKETSPKTNANTYDELNKFFDDYWQERMPFYPLEATSSGDSLHNDLLAIGFTSSYRDSLKTFYTKYLDGINQFTRGDLNESQQISFDIFKREMQIQIEGLSFYDNYTPFNQFGGLPLDLGQLGSGVGNQPFKTIKDYDNWIKRARRFSAWADSAIVYFLK